MLHLLRVEMVINSLWIMPILGTKELASPEQTAPDFLRILFKNQSSRYVVPTGRVIVPTGRYIVSTGRVIVATGKYVIPAVQMLYSILGNYIVGTWKEAHARIKDLKDEIAEQANEENLSTSHNEGQEVDRTMAEHDAKALFKVGEKGLGTDEKIFSHF
nr:annexin D5-like [Tanacetum cinerariifolium]